jgi:hypothetical protein
MNRKIEHNYKGFNGFNLGGVFAMGNFSSNR